MMSDICEVKILSDVIVQENGIIRTSSGLLIGRLVEGVDFEDLTDEGEKPED